MTNIDKEVALYDEALNIIFPNMKLLKIDVIDSSQVMSQPLEMGSRASDHQIFDLIQVDMQVAIIGLDYIQVYNQLDTYQKEFKLFTIQTKVAIYDNMILKDKPRIETPDFGVLLNLKFVHFDQKATEIKQVAKEPQDSSTQKRGTVQGNSKVSEEKKEKRTSALSKVFN